MKTMGNRPERLHENPQQYKDQPVEITLKTERIDESSLIPLAPGVILVTQISKTGKRVPVTHGEQRLLLCLQDDQGKRVQFYQSFAGTGGKQQGWWFPTGGVMADDRGRGAWIIKGSPRTDPGAGRVPLLEFYQRVNEVLPHTDPDTDAWLMQLVGMDYGDFSYKDEYEIVPFIRITEAGNSNELQKKWGSWCYQFWALMVLDKIWGKRTFTPERTAANPYKAVIPIVSGIAYIPNGRTNPMIRPPPTVAMDVEQTEWYSGDGEELTRVDILLFDTAKRGLESLIGGIRVSQGAVPDDSWRWTVSGAAARPGYGPLLYDVAARTVGSSISPGSEQSSHAERFWSRAPDGRISPLTESQFQAKYGVPQVPVRPTPGDADYFREIVRESYFAGTPLERAIRTTPPRMNPDDLSGRHIPERYLAGLPPALQKQRIRELTESRDAYKKGDYSELPTDRTARKMGLVKQSNYTTEAKKRGVEYRGDHDDMARRVFEFYGHRPSAREVTAFAAALRKSFSKGLAAWKSGGHRPGATAQNWAVARVNSLVVGGKTSWTADKKLFEVLPAEVRAKIESMRTKQNPISVRVQGTPPDNVTGRHARYFMSRKALDHIEEKGASVVPNIELVVAWEGDLRHVKGKPGVITLITSPAFIQGEADRVDKVFAGRELPRAGKVSLFTAHTVLHRLGDMIMPREAGMGRIFNAPLVRGPHRDLVVTNRVEVAWRSLGAALFNARGEVNVDQWLPTVVRTKGCREGWIKDFDQAMAELVPYRLLYNNGRENGVKLLSDLPFVPALEAALTEYIDASMEMLTGYQVKI